MSWEPKTSSTACWMIVRIPIVAMMRTSGDALRRGRITSRWIAAPIAALAAIAIAIEGARSHPQLSERRKNRVAEKSASAPWAKFSTPEPR